MRFEHIIIDPESPKNPHIKAAGDINGDGFVDIVVASSDGGPLVWYENPILSGAIAGAQNWKRHVIAEPGWWSTDAKLADMDGDGDLDIVGANWSGDYQPVEMWKQIGASP